MSHPHGRPKEGSLPLGGKARSAKGAHQSHPHGRPKEGSLPLGGKARSAKGAHHTSHDLLSMVCTPCRGGVVPLTAAEAKAYLERAPGWALVDDGRRIERSFSFKNFVEAMNFVAKVGAIAEIEGHHPDISFGWGWADISWQTKKINGLHENDFIMAAKTNALSGA